MPFWLRVDGAQNLEACRSDERYAYDAHSEGAYLVTTALYPVVTSR
jgi:hypothetical protein